MNKAKEALSGFLNRDGKHDTTVHETINPAITNEHVKRTRHEEQQTAIDREVHQDHYHTSVQPVKDREVLPEHHSHNVAGVEHRNIKHGNDDHVKERLANEAAQPQNKRTVGETQHTQAEGATIAGEHVHHHVHENIQPVIQKETVQPSVVHTTIPIHEVHQNEAKHHTATQLPAVSMGEFKNQGGHLGGREERQDAFQGEPRSVGGTIGGSGAHGTTSLTEQESRHVHSHGHGNGAGLEQEDHHGQSHDATTGHSATSGPHNSNSLNKADPRVDSDRDGSRTVGNNNTSDRYTTTGAQNTHGVSDSGASLGAGAGSTIGSGSTAPRTTGTGVGHNASSNVDHTSHSEHGKKPSLMDKLNPKIDSDGDGRAGFMK